MSRDDLILAALAAATPMLRRLAGRYDFEFDDLYQESALLATQITLLRLPAECMTPVGYLKNAIRSNVYFLLRQRHKQGLDATSLDRPITLDDDTCPADLLAVPAQPPGNDERQDERIAALYQALRRLPIEEQQYMREVRQLHAYEPLPPDWTRKPDYSRSRNTVRVAAYNKLRHDRALAAAICL